ncbi:FAD-binding oxidoreductase [Stappia taiwanensis]|uniref:FAD-binding oxidoreductase n=1 Tax=Stappia taiwanensis TaxID=992267 RepID=A0A838Y3J3_9HYPH|nr:FAD-binding oxidoreductase [Stappia taiwanensis]MBA4613533.1 FAD-binding oxidoreductase [Stappia taiwanensis]GGE96517.1 sarcosine oxidase subunit beta [Stappia taiwanensis]
MTGAPLATPDVLVIGAGITGASAALQLAEMGASVELIDRYGPAAMASGWTLAGVRQSGRHPAELPLARSAVALWPELDERLGAETGYRRSGNLRLARNAAEAETIRALVADQSAAGLDLRYLADLAAIREIAPPLSDEVVAASFCPTDGHADPVATVSAFARRASEQGATLAFGETVRHLETRGGRISRVITDRRALAPGAVLLAAGFLANELLAPLGTTLPLRRPMVTVLRSAPIAPLLAPVLGVANADMAARQELTGRLRVTSGAEDWAGGLVERAGAPAIRPRIRSVQATIDKVRRVLPAFAEAELEDVWAGALDLTPDALPVIDRVPEFENLVVAAGFSGHGFGIGPVTGPMAARLAIGEEPDDRLASFRFDRFADGAVATAPLTLHG